MLGSRDHYRTMTLKSFIQILLAKKINGLHLSKAQYRLVGRMWLIMNTLIKDIKYFDQVK